MTAFLILRFFSFLFFPFKVFIIGLLSDYSAKRLLDTDNKETTIL